MEKTIVRITGMHCDACLKVSKMKLGKISGVQEVTVLPGGEATISADRQIPQSEMRDALKDTEYGVE